MRTLPNVFLIEARRNAGFWSFPLLAAMAVWVATAELPAGVSLWPQASIRVHFTVLLIGPFMAALAAWAAGRDRRLRMEELVASTPAPPMARKLAAWAAGSTWGVLAYLATAGYLLVLTSRGATWGSPQWWPILLGLVALGAHSATGYAAGVYLPGRLTAPLVGVALFLANGLTSATMSLRQYLSPTVDLDGSVFYGIRPDLRLGHSLWLLGITGVALAAVALRTRRKPAYWGALLATAAVAATGASALLQVERQPAKELPVVPYEPVCAGAGMPVCVHPAYARLLPGTNKLISELTRPLAGIPGGLVRAQQGVESGVQGGTFVFELGDASDLASDSTRPISLAISLTRDPDSSYAKANLEPSDAQYAIAGWLLRESGRDSSILLRGNDPATAAFERFTRLAPERRKAWLRGNYARLLAGEVGVEEIR